MMRPKAILPFSYFLLLHLSFLATVANGIVLCNRHWDCPGDQVCGLGKDQASSSGEGETKLGLCRCPAGHVPWKWSCYPSVPILGDACTVSQQCRLPREDEARHCNPITKRCACNFNYTAVRGECQRATDPNIIMEESSESTMKTTTMVTEEKEGERKVALSGNATTKDSSTNHTSCNIGGNKFFLDIDHVNSLVLVLLMLTLIFVLLSPQERRRRKRMADSISWLLRGGFIFGRDGVVKADQIAVDRRREEVDDTISYTSLDCSVRSHIKTLNPGLVQEGSNNLQHNLDGSFI